MKNVVITKDFGTGKANAQAKAELTELIMNALIAELGEENVAMIRTALDFETAKQAYIDDLTAKTQEKEVKAKAKTEKIERDKKAREEKKLSKEKETETTAE